MLAEARRWLEEARHDLQVVRTLLQGRHYAAACFYSQQAAEKALKGFLYANYERPPLTHSVQELIEQCMKLSPNLAVLQEKAAVLDQYSIPTRYPDALPAPRIPSRSFTATQAREARRFSEEIVNSVEAIVASRGREGG
jgi:HEPN domain-containing protein